MESLGFRVSSRRSAVRPFGPFVSKALDGNVPSFSANGVRLFVGDASKVVVFPLVSC